MSVIDTYLKSLSGVERDTIQHMYSIVRQLVPDTTEEMSYGMPAYKYKGKGLVAIMANEKFFSLYPFSSIKKLGVDVSQFECTTGSIHFRPDQPITDNMLREIIEARKQQIAKN